MELARLFGIAFVVSLSAVAGCASETTDSAPADESGEVDEINSESLRDATAIKGTITPGGTITIHYDSSDREYPRKVPYLAVEIGNAAGAYKDSAAGLHFANGPVAIATQSMSIQGNFPSTPRALVVDGNFKVLSRGAGVAQPDGSQRIDLNASRDASKRFLLIRDTRWSKPMDFNIAVGR